MTVCKAPPQAGRDVRRSVATEQIPVSEGFLYSHGKKRRSLAPICFALGDRGNAQDAPASEHNPVNRARPLPSVTTLPGEPPPARQTLTFEHASLNNPTDNQHLTPTRRAQSAARERAEHIKPHSSITQSTSRCSTINRLHPFKILFPRTHLEVILNDAQIDHCVSVD